MTIREVVNFAHPVQVMFYDGEGMCSGIMCGDQIICACCGATFWVDEIVENAKADSVDAIKMFETWVDISDEIKGSEADAETAIPLEF